MKATNIPAHTKFSQALRYAAEGTSILEMILRLDRVVPNDLKPLFLEMIKLKIDQHSIPSRQNAAIRQSLLEIATDFESTNL
jgi:hypothetical protein